MFEEIPVDVSPMYEGERIRSANMFVEFAGPKSVGAELIQVADDVEDGKIEVVGPELSDMKEGEIYPLGIFAQIQGKKLEKELEGVIGQKTLELDFFAGALRRIEESRRKKGKTGATASTPKSAGGCNRKVD